MSRRHVVTGLLIVSVVAVPVVLTGAAARWGRWAGDPVMGGRLAAFVAAVFAGLAVTAILRGVAEAVRTVRGTRGALAVLAQLSCPVPVHLAAQARAAGLTGRFWLVADRVPYAATLGILRPIVVVTTGICEHLSPEACDAVLSHEAAHLRARDPLKRALAAVVARALFFFPLARVWLAALERESELAADRTVLRDGGRLRLAEALAGLTETPSAGGLAGFGGREWAQFAASSYMEERVRQLIDYPRPVRVGRDGRLWPACVVSCTVLGAGLVSCEWVLRMLG